MSRLIKFISAAMIAVSFIIIFSVTVGAVDVPTDTTETTETMLNVATSDTVNCVTHSDFNYLIFVVGSLLGIAFAKAFSWWKW